jgi:hypothetical protein
VNSFKERWQIQKNWQLIFPFLGIIALAYLAFKLSNLFLGNYTIVFTFLLSLVVYFLLLKCFLFLFKKLENKWKVNYKWEMISIFLVFATTGSSSVFVSRPIIKLLGITKENLNPIFYWVLYIIIGFIFYQILLLWFGWLFGQFKFFWVFEKKMLSRFGLKRFFN